jgi:uncharacterized membrane-anchored protein
MKRILLLLAILASHSSILLGNNENSLVNLILRQQKLYDSVESALKFQTGNIPLPNGIAKLNIPAGFRYLNMEQSNFVLSKLWGNPPQQGVLGMLFPEKKGPLDSNSYAFIITYDSIGYVKDDDADKINYDDLLKQIQSEEEESNKERVKEGYPAIKMVGWASRPYYDKTNKVLHWAKNLHFGDEETNTLNYEVRILGRKGILSLNAVATMNEIDSVKKDIDKVLKIPSFTDGNGYKDFDSKTDQIAAWTIGSLVAGKILLKVGFWAVLGKFFLAAWKFILLGIAATWGAIKKFFGKKTETTEDVAAPEEQEAPKDSEND